MEEKFSRYYSNLKSFVARGLRTYFGKIQFVGYDEYGKGEGALVFAANHQNTFLDPILIGAFTEKKRQASYITRADVFQNKYADAFFRSIKMVPIYRQRESGSRSVALNQQAFKVYTERLGKKGAMIIFPEGNHAREYRLRPLKKGLPRIVFQTLKEHGRDLPFSIVPVGITYGHHDKYDTDALINYGPPIKAQDFLEEYDTNPQKGLIAMRDVLQEAMQKLVIHIQDENYDTVNALRHHFGGEVAVDMGLNPSMPHDRFRGEKRVIAAAEAHKDAPEFAELAEEVATYEKELAELGIRDHTVAKGPYSFGNLLGETLLGLLGLPLFLYGFLTHLPIYLVAKNVPPKAIKDHEFHAALQFGAGLLLTPLWYLILGLISWAVLGPWWALGIVATLFPIGNFVKPYTDFFKKLRSKFRLMGRVRKGDKRLSELRTSIRAKIWPWVQEKEAVIAE